MNLAGGRVKEMYRSTTWLAVLFAPCLSAQFTGLSSTSDGSSVYFTSTLRLKGADQPLNGKIFVATQEGVKLFRAHEIEGTSASGSPAACTVGGFADFAGAETSSQGVLAASYYAQSSGICSFPVTLKTQIITPAGETLLPGSVRLSDGGRFAISFLAATGRPFSPVSVSYFDIQTNIQTPVPIPASAVAHFVSASYSGGRVIANDGTAVVGVTDGSFQHYGGYLLRPGADPQPFPVEEALPLLIDTDASKVLYQSLDRSLSLLDLRTLESTLLLPTDQLVVYLRMSDDARRLLFVSGGQVHVLDTATLVDQVITNEATTITEATLSGNGRVAYAVTDRGGLLKIDADDGTSLELIGHTPYLQRQFVGIKIPGLAIVLRGSGLSDTAIDGMPPFTPCLGNVTMWIGNRKVPIIRLEPTSVRILIPWDLSGTFRIMAEVPGRNTPFDFPEVELGFPSARPQTGAIARQNWTQTYSGPVNTGEIIHVYAVGLGPVSPEVPDGAAGPFVEPFARLTQRLNCANAEILYAGLAPGTVERVYQVDVRIGPTAGYQQFKCTLGDSAPFVFLTLNVVPGSN